MLPTLRFTDEFFNSIPSTIDRKKRRKISPDELISKAVGNIIDNILMLHSERIEVCEFHNVYWCCDKIRQWILCLASKGVREITLKDKSRCTCYCHPMEVPSALFSCDKLVYLSLKDFKFIKTPAYFGGFQCLKMFLIEKIELNEASELLVKLCPILETLRVVNCTIITNLKLASESLKTLHLEDLENDTSFSITANCPQLTKLEVYCVPEAKLELNCPLLVHLATANSRILEDIPILSSLTKLVLWNAHDVSILSKFPNIEELCISRWDLLPQVSELKVSKLKKLHVLDSSSVKVAVLHHLLKKMPSLETVLISLEKHSFWVSDLEFVNRLLSDMSGTSKVLLSQSKLSCNCSNSNGFRNGVISRAKRIYWLYN